MWRPDITGMEHMFTLPASLANPARTRNVRRISKAVTAREVSLPVQRTRAIRTVPAGPGHNWWLRQGQEIDRLATRVDTLLASTSPGPAALEEIERHLADRGEIIGRYATHASAQPLIVRLNALGAQLASARGLNP